jgi:hypothetical protein
MASEMYICIGHGETSPSHHPIALLDPTVDTLRLLVGLRGYRLGSL